MSRNILSLTIRRSLASSCRSLSSTATRDFFRPVDTFLPRHIGTVGTEVEEMCKTVGVRDLDDLVDKTVPQAIRLQDRLKLDEPLTESEALEKLRGIMNKNKVYKSFIGMGYYETITPPVILRNVIENPGWYTSYTPYQAEISQGRLESLLAFQTMVTDLTGMPLSNASLLDEATAAAEGMAMCAGKWGWASENRGYTGSNGAKNKRRKFFVHDGVHPQTVGLIKTRGEAIGLEIEIGAAERVNFSSGEYVGALIQYPDTYGGVRDWTPFVEKAKQADTPIVAATDLMASLLLKPIGEMGVDVVVGNSQRMGVPLGFGGPHAGFLACTNNFSRKMPGRVIGVSVDSRGKPALRMAMQTREQHIRRERATSNICTAQALLANTAALYAVYHGPQRLKAIATRIHNLTLYTANVLQKAGFVATTGAGGLATFDTFVVDLTNNALKSKEVQRTAAENHVNIRVIDDNRVGISLGESIEEKDVHSLLRSFGLSAQQIQDYGKQAMAQLNGGIPAALQRTSEYLTHPIFNSHHSETQMLRFLKYLENKDLSLTYSMISLGSCTMKLNATSEMIPVTWREVGGLHPFAPMDQAKGYLEMIEQLNHDLATITGFDAVSVQPNSGAQGEYAGLLCIRTYHESRGQGHRNICLIPSSAHGTNPASAVMCGYKVVVVKSDDEGNVDMKDLMEKAEKHKDNLAALMVTYPSTYGLFEAGIKDIINYVHERGGQVYMDGANMNAQVCLTSPGIIGADVCHLNLHKTFCIPHGGGGPGVGAIGVRGHLAPHLPGHAVVPVGGEGKFVKPKTEGAVSAAPYGSPSILPISWMYIKMLGEAGLRDATRMAILNANYMSKRLQSGYEIAFKGVGGYVGHEFIIDLRGFKQFGVTEEDVAKRLQDYGFHSPTMSWPVGGTLMIEPTESEDKAELDRFCDALLLIRQEIQDVVDGKVAIAESPLRNAPHTMDVVTATEWNRGYSRQTAAFPGPWQRGDGKKYWPTVGRVDNVYGDRHLVCTCPPVELYEKMVA